MAKINVFFTGGTIGSQVTGSAAEATDGAASRLIHFYRASRPSCTVEFRTEVLLNTLSENISPAHWAVLYNRVCGINGDCDGIIITHGTDTLAYTAAYLSFMLRLDVPVLLVSSDYPLDDARANGHKNFAAAVDFILQVNVCGVFVPFAKNGVTKIHLGSRLLQAHPYTHDFSSLGNVWLGEFRDGSFFYNSDPHNPGLENLKAVPRFFIPPFEKMRDVFYISPYPGMDYSLISFPRKPAAVLHGLYHSGTACTAPDERFSVIPFARHCIEAGIDFYAAPFEPENTLYATSRDMAEAGVRFMENISVEASYVKLLIAYSAFEGERERQEFIRSDIAFEKFLRSRNVYP